MPYASRSGRTSLTARLLAIKPAMDKHDGPLFMDSHRFAGPSAHPGTGGGQRARSGVHPNLQLSRP